jgi:hypothetical protein
MNARVNTQVEDMVSAWSRFQGQLWDSLFGIGKGNVAQPWEQLYSRPLEVGEDIVNSLLQQQSDCIRITMKNARPGNGAPKVLGEWADQFENAAQHWVDAQRQAWKTWFAAVKQMDPYRAQGSSKGRESHADNVFEAWQQATQKTLQAQADWMSSLVSAGAKVTEEIVQSVKVAGNGGAHVAHEAAESAKKAGSASKSAGRGSA